MMVVCNSWIGLDLMMLDVVVKVIVMVVIVVWLCLFDICDIN